MHSSGDANNASTSEDRTSCYSGGLVGAPAAALVDAEGRAVTQPAARWQGVAAPPAELARA